MPRKCFRGSLENAFEVPATLSSPQGVRSIGRQLFDNLRTDSFSAPLAVSLGHPFHLWRWPSGKGLTGGVWFRSGKTVFVWMAGLGRTGLADTFQGWVARNYRYLSPTDVDSSAATRRNEPPANYMTLPLGPFYYGANPGPYPPSGPGSKSGCGALQFSTVFVRFTAHILSGAQTPHFHRQGWPRRPKEVENRT